MNGFINIHLLDEQFVDRVGVLRLKKKVSNSDRLFQGGDPLEEEPDQSYSIKPIGYLQSCFREKFGTPR